MRFRYINMPKLVAFYLKEFSVRSDGETSNLYKFVFCLCLPFVSNTFNRARMIALGIAECTVSRDQVSRLLHKITGADVSFVEYVDEFYCGYDGTNDSTVTLFGYRTDISGAIMPYEPVPNAGNMLVTLNGYDETQFKAYLSLLIPFYINFKISFND